MNCDIANDSASTSDTHWTLESGVCVSVSVRHQMLASGYLRCLVPAVFPELARVEEMSQSGLESHSVTVQQQGQQPLHAQQRAGQHPQILCLSLLLGDAPARSDQVMSHTLSSCQVERSGAAV